MALPNKPAFDRLVRALHLAMDGAGLDANYAIGSVLSAWCQKSFPRLPEHTLPSNQLLQVSEEVSRFVDFISGQELVEATYWLSSAYALLLGKVLRKKYSMFFTPPSLTRRLLDDLQEAGVNFATRKFCDPACGGAAFLTPISIRMRDALREYGIPAAKIIQHIESHILGIEKDPVLCDLSKHFIMMALHDEIVEAGRVPILRIRSADSLLEIRTGFDNIDVVVCNPPFRKLRADEVDLYRDAYADVIEAQPNVYAIFIALCVKLLTPGGVCALVTPTSFLSGQYFSKLRTHLMTHTTILNIGMVSDRIGVFIDVEQETALTLARKDVSDCLRSNETKVSVVSRDGTYVSVGTCSLSSSGDPWPIPRSEPDLVLLRNSEKSKARLSDYGYKARIGAFVWNRDERLTYLSAEDAGDQIRRSAVPLLWSSDIRAGGELHFDGQPKANNEPCFIQMGSLDHRSIIRRPSVILQRVTSNDQPRRLVAAYVPQRIIDFYGGFVGENHIVVLEQQSHKPELTPTQLAKLLSTTTVDRCFRCISGATNVSIFELNQLNLPDPSRLKRHLKSGHDMSTAARMAIEEV